ncbi:MAG TPA: ATP-binding protein [Coleofasciculaceae cyanobacterium]
MEFLQTFFVENPFVLQQYCYFENPGLMWLHIGADSLIALAYYSIPITLVYLIQKRQDLPFKWIFLLFGAFILSCGTTHLIAVWTLWHPIYWASGFMKALTAGASMCTAVVLVAIIPQVLAFPNPTLLEAANRKLEAEIFERKRIEEKLRSSQQMLQLVMDNIPELIFWKDRNSIYLGCNRNFAQVAGLDAPEEIVGKSDYDLPWKKEQSDFFVECDTRVMETDTPKYHIIEPLLEADGKQHWNDTNKIPLHDAEENVVGILCTVEDISDRIQAEEELRQSEARFREVATREALLNRLSSQIRASLDCRIILKTAVAEIHNLLQLERCLFLWYRPNAVSPCWEVVQEARNSDLASFIGNSIPVIELEPLTGKAFAKEIVRVDDTRTSLEPVEQKFFLSLDYTAVLAMPIHTQSGEIGMISCSHSSQPRLWSESEVELLQAVADQIAIAIEQAKLLQQSRIAAATAQAQATKLEVTLCELQQTQAQLIQSEKMSCLGQLVAGVAHEINNPVSFVYGNLFPAYEYAKDLLNLIQLYQEYYPAPVPEIQANIEEIDLNFIKDDLPKIFSSMTMGANRIREIVLSLRNFSRTEQSEMDLVDIHEGLDSTLLILSNRLKAKPKHLGIQVIKEYGDLPPVKCYAGHLNQVFMNILTNAIDAIEEYNKKRSIEDLKNNPSTILIHTDVLDNKNVMIQIIDNGPGMTEEVRRRLFEAFFTTKPIGLGTGLGMSISYQIVVEKHKGRLQCISAPSQGTEFLIYIPIQQQESSLLSQEALVSITSPTRG